MLSNFLFVICQASFGFSSQRCSFGTYVANRRGGDDNTACPPKVGAAADAPVAGDDAPEPPLASILKEERGPLPEDEAGCSQPSSGVKRPRRHQYFTELEETLAMSARGEKARGSNRMQDPVAREPSGGSSTTRQGRTKHWLSDSGSWPSMRYSSLRADRSNSSGSTARGGPGPAAQLRCAWKRFSHGRHVRTV